MSRIQAFRLRCLHEDPLPEVSQGMTNYDHSVDEGMADALADGKHMGNYAGWNFHALVYKVEGEFIADVHVWGTHRAWLGAKSLDALMEVVSHEYGQD